MTSVEKYADLTTMHSENDKSFPNVKYKSHSSTSIWVDVDQCADR